MNYNCPVCKFNKHPFWEFTNFTKKKVSFKSCPKCNSTLEINYHVSEQRNRKRISVCMFCCVLCNIIVFFTQGIIGYIFAGLELCSLFLLFYFLIRIKKMFLKIGTGILSLTTPCIRTGVPPRFILVGEGHIRYFNHLSIFYIR